MPPPEKGATLAESLGVNIGGADKRREKRYPFHWPVAIVFDATDDRDTYHGVTHELSLTGCSVLTEHNVFSEHPISLLVSLPVEHPGARRRVVEIRCRMVYTVLSSGHQMFRCGIQFVNFKGNGRTLLRRVIERRAITI